MAHRFASGGWRIVAVARRKERLDTLGRELSAQTDVEAVGVDVTLKDAGTISVAAAMKRFGRLDCLVNNAGSFKFAPVLQTDDTMLDEVVDISLKAPFRFCRAALEVMKPGSSIINIGSVWGILAGMGGAGYCTVKAALIGLTQSIAIDYGRKGIRANLVAPSVVKTDMTKDFWDTAFFQRTNQELTPLNRDCTLSDVANMVYFLASEEAGFVNGQTIALDGGWSKTKFLSTEAIVAERMPAKG
jgi:3-oxoacyl-[acyl-carrier protein] reductase